MIHLAESPPAAAGNSDLFFEKQSRDCGLRVVDLFAGAGGMSLGFTLAGFRTVWANDISEQAVKTHNKNFGPHAVSGDILKLLKDGALDGVRADVVIGGPPCQGFSLLNKKRENDPRKELWRPYMEVVKKVGAKAFVMENVPQILGSSEFVDILKEAKKQGFKVSYDKLCAADFGVSQQRWRAFIVGCKTGDPAAVFPPQSTHVDPKLLASGRIKDKRRPWATVRAAIGDLESPIGVEIRKDLDGPYDLHFGRQPTPLSMRRYKAIPKEGMNRFDLQRVAPELTPACWIRKTKGGTDLFGRLWWDRPAFTIRTEFFKPEKGRYLHPKQHRPLTHREAARLQGFPDEFKFVGSKTEIAMQIGNAVPPPLAQAVAGTVKALLAKKR